MACATTRARTSIACAVAFPWRLLSSTLLADTLSISFSPSPAVVTTVHATPFAEFHLSSCRSPHLYLCVSRAAPLHCSSDLLASRCCSSATPLSTIQSFSTHSWRQVSLKKKWLPLSSFALPLRCPPGLFPSDGLGTNVDEIRCCCTTAPIIGSSAPSPNTPPLAHQLRFWDTPPSVSLLSCMLLLGRSPLASVSRHERPRSPPVFAVIQPSAVHSGVIRK